MPTAAKLTAAILFTIIGWMAGVAYIATLPEGQPAGMIAPVAAAIGLFQGWFTMGRNADGQVMGNLGTGVRTSIQVAFFVVIVFGLNEMFYRSTRLRYGGPDEAVIAALELFMEYGLELLAATTCIIILLVGGAVAGIITGFVGRRWS